MIRNRYRLREVSIIDFKDDLLKKALTQNNSDEWNSNIRYDKLLFIVNELYNKQFYSQLLLWRNSRHDSVNFNTAAPLRAGKDEGGLEDYVGSKFTTKALRVLRKCNVICVVSNYITGKRSRHYVFGAKFFDAIEIKLVDRNDTKLSRHIAEETEKKIRSNLIDLKRNPTHLYLYKALFDTSLPPNIISVVEKYLKGKSDKQITFAKAIVSKFMSRSFHFSCSDYGRIYTSVTSMHSFLRDYILIGGEKTVEIDIVNAQPFFLYTLYPSGSSVEKSKYRRIVKAGKFYEEINKLLPRPFNLKRSRKKLKKKIYAEIFYGPNPKKGGNPESLTAFKKEFPEITDIVWKMKEPRYKLSNRDTAHKKFSRKMQKIESDIMINKVAGRIRREHPAMVVLTIHDSIRCKESDRKIVKKIMYEEIESFCGIKPKLKTN